MGKGELAIAISQSGNTEVIPETMLPTGQQNALEAGMISRKITLSLDPIYFLNLEIIPETLYGVRILHGCEISVLNNGTLSLEQKYIDRLDYEKLVKAARETHVALEVNKSSLLKTRL